MEIDIAVPLKASKSERADEFNRVCGEIERIERAAKEKLEALAQMLALTEGTEEALKEKYRAEAGIIVKKAHEEMHILMSQRALKLEARS